MFDLQSLNKLGEGDHPFRKDELEVINRVLQPRCGVGLHPADLEPVEEVEQLPAHNAQLDFCRPPLLAAAWMGVSGVQRWWKGLGSPVGYVRVLCVDTGTPFAQVLSRIGVGLAVTHVSLSEPLVGSEIPGDGFHWAMVNVCSPAQFKGRRRLLDPDFDPWRAPSPDDSAPTAEWFMHIEKAVSLLDGMVLPGGVVVVLGAHEGGAYFRAVEHLRDLLHVELFGEDLFDGEDPVWFPQVTHSPRLEHLGLPQASGRLLSLWRAL